MKRRQENEEKKKERIVSDVGIQWFAAAGIMVWHLQFKSNTSFTFVLWRWLQRCWINPLGNYVWLSTQHTHSQKIVWENNMHSVNRQCTAKKEKSYLPLHGLYGVVLFCECVCGLWKIYEGLRMKVTNKNLRVKPEFICTTEMLQNFSIYRITSPLKNSL